MAAIIILLFILSIIASYYWGRGYDKRQWVKQKIEAEKRLPRVCKAKN
jgi:hypothetical protein